MSQQLPCPSGPSAPMTWTHTPMQVLQRWPKHLTVPMLHSGRVHESYSKSTLFGLPSRWIAYHPKIGWKKTSDSKPPVSSDPCEGLSEAIASNQNLWMGYCSYDLARHIETLPSLASDDRDTPWLVWYECESWLIHDPETGWRACGAASKDPSLIPVLTDNKYQWDSSQESLDNTDTDHENRVKQTKDFIANGDIFQANIAHRFQAKGKGNLRKLYENLHNRSPAWFGAYLEFPEQQTTLLSTSPELFLALHADGRALTRPIKGTLPSNIPAAQLENSEKDCAELHMIVDLMRNDLGRICLPGTIQVTHAREIEWHPTVWQATGTVEGIRRIGITVADILRATFPPGSVTGAPKVRAMAIIDALESSRRGPYCGCMGWLQSTANHVQGCLNVAIRTMVVHSDDHTEHHAIDFWAGGGIVADSQPTNELQETYAKARALTQALKD